jgi:hypothetical protein
MAADAPTRGGNHAKGSQKDRSSFKRVPNGIRRSAVERIRDEPRWNILAFLFALMTRVAGVMTKLENFYIILMPIAFDNSHMAINLDLFAKIRPPRGMGLMSPG